MSKMSKKRKRAGRQGYVMIPIVAMSICLLMATALYSGGAHALEEKIKEAAQNEQISEVLLEFVMTGTVTEQPLPEHLQQTPEGDSTASQVQTDSQAVEQVASEEEMLIESAPPFADMVEEKYNNNSDIVAISDTKGEHVAPNGQVSFKNNTEYDIDTSKLLSEPFPFELDDDGPQILIMHTHGTESYEQDDGNLYEESDYYRTTDDDYNMIYIGSQIAEHLNERGISTVHSTTLNDYPKYSGSYDRALDDIEYYLEKYPSIKIVIDVHRDAIESDGVTYKTHAEVEGENSAQLMFVAGTNEGGLSHDDWWNNLSFQMQLHSHLNESYPGIMRPMSIRKERFNQHATPGSMLLEVGSNGNNLTEAILAAEIFAQTLADVLLGE